MWRDCNQGPCNVLAHLALLSCIQLLCGALWELTTVLHVNSMATATST